MKEKRRLRSCTSLGVIDVDFAHVTRSPREGGTAVVVGIARGEDMRCAPPPSPSSKTFTGSFFASARPHGVFPKLIDMHRSGELKLDELITRTYTLDEATLAFAGLAHG